MSEIAFACCKRCGSEKVVCKSGTWGPHNFRIECKEPNCRAVTWGRPPHPFLYNEIAAARARVQEAEREYLLATGWKPSSSSPDNEWRKTVKGSALSLPTEFALYFQRVLIEGKPL